MDILPPLAHRNIRWEEIKPIKPIKPKQVKEVVAPTKPNHAGELVTYLEIRQWSNGDKNAFRILAAQRDNFKESYDAQFGEPKLDNHHYRTEDEWRYRAARERVPKPGSDDAPYHKSYYCATCDCWCDGKRKTDHRKNCSQHRKTTEHRGNCDEKRDTCGCNCSRGKSLCPKKRGRQNGHLVKGHKRHMENKTHIEWFKDYQKRKDAAYKELLAKFPIVSGCDSGYSKWFDRWIRPPPFWNLFPLFDDRDWDYDRICERRTEYRDHAERVIMPYWEKGQVDPCYEKLAGLQERWKVDYDTLVKDKLYNERKRMERERRQRPPLRIPTFALGQKRKRGT